MYLSKIAVSAVILTFFSGLVSTNFPYSYTELKQMIGYDVMGFVTDCLSIVLNFIPSWVIPTFLSTFLFFLTIKISIVIFNKILSIWGGS